MIFSGSVLVNENIFLKGSHTEGTLIIDTGYFYGEGDYSINSVGLGARTAINPALDFFGAVNHLRSDGETATEFNVGIKGFNNNFDSTVSLNYFTSDGINEFSLSSELYYTFGNNLGLGIEAVLAEEYVGLGLGIKYNF